MDKMLNWVVDFIEDLILSELNSKAQLLKILAVMVAAALILGATFTQAFEFAHSIVVFVATAGSLAFVVVIIAAIARFSDILNSLLKF